MKPEKILCAMNDIDDRFLKEAREEAAPRRRPRRFPALVAAVLALTAVTVTAFAAEEIAGWFAGYFSARTDTSLSPEQVRYIAENEQVIGETQEENGWTVRLKSVLADSGTVYATLSISAPTDLPFNETTMLSSEGIDFYDQNSKPCRAMSMRILEDGDGLATTADLLMEFTPSDRNSGKVWTLRIQKLTAWVHDTEYEQQLLDTKYAGQTDIMFTDEEAAQIYKDVTLAEGPWEFTVDLSESAAEELEMITEPVTAQSCYGFKSDGTNVYEEVSITSFLLRPLSATVTAESTGALDLTPTADHKLFAVMKDGTQVELRPDWGMTGQQQFTAESPIVLDRVDHILLPDGTRIPAP